MRSIHVGQIIEPSRGNIRDHERRTAQAIANTGLSVEFIIKLEQDFTKSPDVLINSTRWEMKSPTTNKLSQIEMNLKRANKQSAYIIIDSQRIKHIPDSKLLSFLTEQYKRRRSIKKLLFVNRRRKVIDLER